jgi:F420-0:gamma-glutamyl ligase
MDEGSILVVASKVAALCEGRTVSVAGTDREALIAREADYYVPPHSSTYGHHFTIVHNTLVGSAGIDESNGDGSYVLWPANPQQTANALRAHLAARFGLQNMGVIVADSTSQPFRLGAIGIDIAHSGFEAVHSYVGEKDLFGRSYTVERSNIGSGLAAAAVVAMGEGNEQTPFCLLTDLPFVAFQDRDPSPKELAAARLDISNDLFEPFWHGVDWQKGK